MGNYTICCLTVLFAIFVGSSKQMCIGFRWLWLTIRPPPSGHMDVTRSWNLMTIQIPSSSMQPSLCPMVWAAIHRDMQQQSNRNATTQSQNNDAYSHHTRSIVMLVNVSVLRLTVNNNNAIMIPLTEYWSKYCAMVSLGRPLTLSFHCWSTLLGSLHMVAWMGWAWRNLCRMQALLSCWRHPSETKDHVRESSWEPVAIVAFFSRAGNGIRLHVQSSCTDYMYSCPTGIHVVLMNTKNTCVYVDREYLHSWWTRIAHLRRTRTIVFSTKSTFSLAEQEDMSSHWARTHACSSNV